MPKRALPRPWHPRAQELWAMGHSIEGVLNTLAEEGTVVAANTFANLRQRNPEDFPLRRDTGVKTIRAPALHVVPRVVGPPA